LEEVMANRNVARAVRLALIAASTAGAVGAPVALAQEAQELEQIVVTGSRIARPDYESASPIVSVSEELFKQSGSATVETVLNSLPQFVPSVTNTSNNPSNGGQANVELRGLGTSRTLVLMDGKRVIPANPTGVVDLNMLPSGLLQNVEVITGGASAVYGSDAVAGVVNFRLRDMQGIEFDGNYQITGRGDGEEYTAAISAGTHFADDRGKAMFSYSYANRDAVYQGDRKFSEVSLDTVPDPGPLGSGTIRQGRWDSSSTNPVSQAALDTLFGSYGYAPGTVVNGNMGFNQDGSLFYIGTSTRPVANFRGNMNEPLQPVVNPYTYNFAPVNYLQLPLERNTLFGKVSFEVNEAFVPYAQAIWSSYTVDQQLAPTPLTGISIPVTNPFVAQYPDVAYLLANRTVPTRNFTWRKRMEEVGPRISSNDYDVYQYMVGATGDLAFGKGWNYDVYFSQGETKWTEKQQGNISTSAVESLVNAADGGASLCAGGWDPFAGIGGISAACADYVSRDANNDQTVKMTVAEGSISGALFDMPAGEVKTAFGIFYKKDEYEYKPDAVLQVGCPYDCDIQGFNANLGYDGSTDSTELYVEALFPLLKDVTGAQALDLNLGYRYADYNTVGGVSSYKGELLWQPVEMARVRGSYQRAVRAPNLSELFTPQQVNFPSIPSGDPCEGVAIPSAAADLCVAQGIPATALPNYSYAFSQVEGFSSGNPDLSEETADTYSFGIVLSSPFENELASNLQLSIDWYSISIDDAIIAISANTFIQRCFNDRGANPSYDPNNFYCGFFDRDSSSGDIINALEISTNAGKLEVSGIDMQLDWRAPIGPGTVGVNWLATWTDSYEITQYAGDGISDDYAGFAVGGVGTSYPEWKSNFNLGYTWGNLGLNGQWRFVGSMDDWNYPDFKIDSENYFDLNASYTWDDGLFNGLTLRAGVENLGDVQPPFFPSYTQSNTDPSQYDVLGRRYFVGVNYVFGGNK
jgi:outer membrane receptor protein involved in Fe transport